MSSGREGLTAEERFRQAFERLKANKPNVLGRNTPVSQNNVAKEASCDPSALKKARFPSLIREIQAYVEINGQEQPSKRKEQLRQRSARAALKDRLHDVVVQRDLAQSQLISAQRRVIELAYEVDALKRELEQANAGRPVSLR
ncbi:hypothetical protein [Stenotrophomonas maltophilia]|jgi:hypothetical protein|uniref:hypothetical protein n=1 Tax=Stenotrophomonas maltophilia TaxID=40324 RepID=UPI0011D20936|nr:hypothetical protein [Stenotrophomonas maltophilia]